MSKRKVFPDLCWDQRRKRNLSPCTSTRFVCSIARPRVSRQGFPGWSVAGLGRDALSCSLLHICMVICGHWESLVSSRVAVSWQLLKQFKKASVTLPLHWHGTPYLSHLGSCVFLLTTDQQVEIRIKHLIQCPLAKTLGYDFIKKIGVFPSFLSLEKIHKHSVRALKMVGEDPVLYFWNLEPK